MENTLFALAVMEIRKYPYMREYLATQSFLHGAQRRGNAKDVAALQRIIDDMKKRIDYITNRQQKIFDFRKFALIFASDRKAHLQAARQGDSDSMRFLAYEALFRPLLQPGMSAKDRQESLNQSLSWFSQLAGCDPLSKTLCGEIHLHAYYPICDVERGIQLLKEAAMDAIPIAAYILGNRHFFLYPQDYQHAISWYSLCPSCHDINWRVGVCYCKLGSMAGAELYFAFAVERREHYISQFWAYKSGQLDQVDLAYHASEQATAMEILQEVIDRCDLWDR